MLRQIWGRKRNFLLIAFVFVDEVKDTSDLMCVLKPWYLLILPEYNMNSNGILLYDNASLILEILFLEDSAALAVLFQK